MAAYLGELAANLPIAAEEGRGLRERGDWRRRIFTSWDCPQNRVPELAPAQGTAFPSSARIRTRVPAALRAAGRRARTRLASPAPAGLASLRRARSATPRARRLPALALRLPAPPHPPLRRARWEPLAEARGTATDLRRPGSDAGAGSQPGGSVGSAHPQSTGRTPPPPPAHLRQAHLPPVLGVLAVPTAPQATRACVCGAQRGAGGVGNGKLAGRTHTQMHAVNQPGLMTQLGTSFQSLPQKVYGQGTASGCSLPPGHWLHPLLSYLPAARHGLGDARAHHPNLV